MQTENVIDLISKTPKPINNINNINIEELVDIKDVHIRTDLKKEERITDFIKQIKNPYVCKCGDVIIHSVFSEGNSKLSDKMREYFKMVQ